MNAARHLVVVKAPVDRVYEQWSRLEDLPKFVTPLQDVCRIDETHFSYTWLPNGSEEKGIFHIVLQIPGRRIAWRTMSNGFMCLSHRVEEYLRNFKRLVESEAGVQ